MSAGAVMLNEPHDLRPRSAGRRPAATVLAAFLPAAAVLLMLGEVLTPDGLDKPTTTVPAAMKAISIGAAHSGRLYSSNLLVIFGLAALGVSFSAIATLTRSRASAIGVAAALLGGLAAFCGAVGNVLVGFNVATAATAHTTPAAAAQVLVSADTSAVSTMLLVGYLGGGLVAIILLVTALLRSGAAPRWLAALFGLGLVIAAASRPGVGAVVMQLPFAAAMILLATRVRSQGSQASQ